jgi:hypothetical protein
MRLIQITADDDDDDVGQGENNDDISSAQQHQTMKTYMYMQSGGKLHMF